jgi:hypothetical protein
VAVQNTYKLGFFICLYIFTCIVSRFISFSLLQSQSVVETITIMLSMATLFCGAINSPIASKTYGLLWLHKYWVLLDNALLFAFLYLIFFITKHFGISYSLFVSYVVFSCIGVMHGAMQKIKQARTIPWISGSMVLVVLFYAIYISKQYPAPYAYLFIPLCILFNITSYTIPVVSKILYSKGLSTSGNLLGRFLLPSLLSLGYCYYKNSDFFYRSAAAYGYNFCNMILALLPAVLYMLSTKYTNRLPTLSQITGFSIYIGGILAICIQSIYMKHTFLITNTDLYFLGSIVLYHCVLIIQILRSFIV